jgi:hypothetical protein
MIYCLDTIRPILLAILFLKKILLLLKMDKAESYDVVVLRHHENNKLKMQWIMRVKYFNIIMRVNLIFDISIFLIKQNPIKDSFELSISTYNLSTSSFIHSR